MYALMIRIYNVGFGLLRCRDKYSPCDRGNENLMKDLKGLLGEFRGWPTVELFSVRLAGLSAEDRERHLLGFCKLAFGHYEELPMGYRRLVDGYLDRERGENLMVWYLTSIRRGRMPVMSCIDRTCFADGEAGGVTDRDGRLPYSHLAACLCMAFFVRSLSDPNSEVLPKSLASRLSALNILPSDILELAGKREITDEM